MKQTFSLGDLTVDILPPKVVMLLSKYSHRLRKVNGIVLKLSSKTILKELERINSVVGDDILRGLYSDIENEFSGYLNIIVGNGAASGVTDNNVARIQRYHPAERSFSESSY